MKHHLRHMAIGGGLILAVLLALRVDLRTALTYALLLACPLGMVGMMVMMNKQGQGGHDHGADGHDQGAGGHEHCGGHEHGSTSTPADAHQHLNAPDADLPLTRENHERLP
jgi:hypothetical protein